MYSKEKYIEMLSSKEASSRYTACEWIRAFEESFPEIVTALEKATHDKDKEVAERAKLALQAEIHHQMAIKMGIIEPDKIEVEYQKRLSTEINKKSSSSLYKVGRIFLGLIIAVFIFILIRWIIDYLFPHSNPYYVTMFDAYPFLAFYIMLISIIILVSAFALVRKYPILIGAILLALGVMSIILLLYYPPLEIGGNDISTLFICIPWYLVIMLFGFLFLRFGLIDKGKGRIK